MNLEVNKNLGNWLTHLNGQTVDKIFQIDYNNDRHNDDYLPWLFFITFLDLNKFLEIEGDFDGSHIKLRLCDIAELDRKIKENNFPDEQDLWKVYNTEPNETLGELLGKTIEFVELGIDKAGFEINGTVIKGERDVFTFIRFVCGETMLTIFEGHATGLDVSNNPDVEINFRDTFNTFNTRKNRR